jgi:hypothetical protein
MPESKVKRPKRPEIFKALDATWFLNIGQKGTDKRGQIYFLQTENKSVPFSAWHHDAYRERILQLIPTAQHRSGGVAADILHSGQKGGMEL